MDSGTLATIYVICAFTFGAWYTFHWFYGGRESKFYQHARARTPSFDLINPWAVFVMASFVIIVCCIVWPLALVAELVTIRRMRRNSAALYLHPRLRKLRKRLAGHEEQYEKILTKAGLGAVVTALHAVDLDAVVEYGLNAIARKRGDGETPAERPAVEEFEEANYVNVMKVAVGYIEINELGTSYNRAKLEQSKEISNDLARRFDHIRNPGVTIGELIVFRIHGWAPMRRLTFIRQKYTPQLKPGFNNADHMAEVFGGIRVTDERNIKQVAQKNADMSAEEYAQAIEEHIANQPRLVAPRGEDHDKDSSL